MTFIKTLITIAVVVAAGIVILIYSGIYNVAADEPHWKLTSWLLQTTQERSVMSRADEVIAPEDLSMEERYRDGAANYASMCQMCHSGPGIEPTELHRGLRPMPPELTEIAPHHSLEYLFWVVKHGIKMTGMPAWGESHSDEAIWNIVAFIQQLPETTPAEYQALTANADHH